MHIKCTIFLFVSFTDGTAVAQELITTGNPLNLSARGNNNDCGDSSFILLRFYINFKMFFNLFLQKHLTR